MRQTPVAFGCEARSIPNVQLPGTCSVEDTASRFETHATCPATARPPLPRRPDRINPVAQGFGAAVRRAREARDETLEDVAGRIPRLDPRYLGEIELGWHAPTIVTAKRLADALDTPLAVLVEDI